MNKKKVKLCVLLLSGLGLAGLQAQVAVPAAGGNASGSGGTGSYTVGQVVYGSSTGTNGSVAQGVQQAYVITVFTGVDNAGIELSYKVYPNPTTDNLNLKLINFEKSTYSYQLFDVSGKMLESKTIVAEETSISMQALTGGNYLLKIVETKPGAAKELKSFKIIKK